MNPIAATVGIVAAGVAAAAISTPWDAITAGPGLPPPVTSPGFEELLIPGGPRGPQSTTVGPADVSAAPPTISAVPPAISAAVAIPPVPGTSAGRVGSSASGGGAGASAGSNAPAGPPPAAPPAPAPTCDPLQLLVADVCVDIDVGLP